MTFKIINVLLALAAVGCGREVSDVGVKMVGVGYDPDEIGPAPMPYGGIIEYNWVDFAGAGLSLAFTGLVSFESVPSVPTYRPPYALVGSTAIFYDQLVYGAANAGVVLEAPQVADSCYTTIEPTGPMGFADTVDVGSWLKFVNSDGSAGFSVDRMPADYPPDPQDVYVYYSSIASWRTKPIIGYEPGTGETYESMQPRTLVPANYPHGDQMVMQFPGSVAPQYAPVSSIPFPSSKAGEQPFSLPHRQEGVRMTWKGPRYDRYGIRTAEEGDQSTCLTYYWPEGTAPGDLATCAAGPEIEVSRTALAGQIYTGPWEAEDQQVRFEWAVPEGAEEEVVTLSVRFLGPMDLEKDQYLRLYMVNYENADDLGNGREALPCEGKSEEVPGDWALPADYYVDDEGTVGPELRGDPFHTVAEVTCRLTDDGDFTLNRTMLEDALAAATSRGAEGAVFFFNRSTQKAVELPAAKDYYDHQKNNSPILLRANSVEIGRFWY